jgi:hypothetical protein
MFASARNTDSLRRSALSVLAAFSLIVPVAGAEAYGASPSEMRELLRLLRENGPANTPVVVEAGEEGAGLSLIIASHSEGPDGRPVVTLGLQSRLGMMRVGVDGPDIGPGDCNVVLQDTDGNGTPDFAEFHCDRISAELPQALGTLGQPLFDEAVRALIRRLTTV